MRVAYIFNSAKDIKDFMQLNVVKPKFVVQRQAYPKIETPDGSFISFMVIRDLNDAVNSLRGMEFDFAIYDYNVRPEVRFGADEFIRTRLRQVSCQDLSTNKQE
jgi:hypothetical protein